MITKAERSASRAAYDALLELETMAQNARREIVEGFHREGDPVFTAQKASELAQRAENALGAYRALRRNPV